MKLRLTGYTLALALAAAGTANAAPMLQLDIAGGRYDASTQTTVATSNPFTLYALLTLSPNDDVAKYLDKTYFISAALSPAVHQGINAGSFTFNGTTVAATTDMVYGTPPVETFEELQGHDGGDLGRHSIYPTYFQEFGFKFVSTSRVNTYDTAIDGLEPITNPNGGSYLAAFTVNTSMLDPRFLVHFDLYDSTIKKCGTPDQRLVGGTVCEDIDVRSFAPFSHDAQSPPVPEPASMLLLGAGLSAGALRRFRQRKVSA